MEKKYFKEEKDSQIVGLDSLESSKAKDLLKERGIDLVELSLYKTLLRKISERCGYGRGYRSSLAELHKFMIEIPDLSDDAFSEIYDLFIKDLFIEEDFLSVFKAIIEKYGKTDKAYLTFKKYVVGSEELYKQELLSDIEIAKEYMCEYDSQYVTDVIGLIKDYKVRFSKIKELLPSKEIVNKDCEQLTQMVKQTRIFFGVCEPQTYSLLKDTVFEGIDSIKEDKVGYMINGVAYDATFTIEEYIDSIKKQKKLKK